MITSADELCRKLEEHEQWVLYGYFLAELTLSARAKEDNSHMVAEVDWCLQQPDPGRQWAIDSAHKVLFPNR